MDELIFNLATAPTSNTKTWKNKKISWQDFVRRLSSPYHTSETFKEFLAFDKETQHQIKDVGAYFGGYIRSGRRLKGNILSRQLVTLDIDFGYTDMWEDFTTNFSCAAIIHSTHKHCEESPRYRLIIPLDREVTPDEYTAISRQIAGAIDIDLFDGTTFDVNRYMFWQSTPKDVKYYFKQQKGEYISADDILNSYVDWTDISSYPRSSTEAKSNKAFADKAEDPTLKKGIIGAFCRTYSIREAIEQYLPDVYEPLEDGNRYTFLGGTTAGGAIVYDDMFLFSHHSTDPCSNRLCNSFDLVRMHLFEGETEEKSMSAMQDKILEDENVKRTLAKEKLSSADMDFEDIEGYDVEVDEDVEADWMSKMDADKKGNFHPTAGNFSKIVKNDARLKGMFGYNEFAQRIFVLRSVPWRAVPKPEPLRTVDFAGLRNYIERIYGISSPMKLEDALILEAEKYKFHPVKEYLDSLEPWDRKERVRRLFPVWIGAESCEYTYDATKQFLIGAIKRIKEAGCKMDTVLTFVGEQGVGKSEIISKLGGTWYSDTLTTIHGREGMEQIQGSWLIEMAELAGLKKADLESQKHFISKKRDIYRPSYGRTLEDFPRQCVFIATTNDLLFLKDMTGNRRFIPILVSKERRKKNPYFMKKEYVDKIWAEALHLYKTEGFKIIEDLEEIQKEFLDTDPRCSQVEEFLNTPLPIDWNTLTISDKKLFFEMPDISDSKVKRVQRLDVSPIEIYVECFGQKLESFNRMEARNIKDILKILGWVESTPRKIKEYGSQRVYKRKN